MTAKQRHAIEMKIHGSIAPRKRGHKTYAYFDSIGRLRYGFWPKNKRPPHLWAVD